MRRLSHGALSLLIIFLFLACGGDEPGAARSQTEQARPIRTITPTAARPLPATRQEEAAPPASGVPVYTYEIVNAWPHDPKAFTQGLVFHDGNLYESTGHHGSSTLRRVELKTGKVKKNYNVPTEYFAEGIAILQNKIYQLTWQSHKCFIYDLKSFKLEGEFHQDGEGWGLTDDGHLLIMSDGTNQLRFLDPATFLPVRTINVLDRNHPLLDINELEYIKGEIYANIWHSDRIVRIDPSDGKITGWIDLTGLRPTNVEQDSDNVLNGIAYDEHEDRLFVTGKRWPKLFEIRLIKK
jgi:glutamine cyclotransferase